MTMSYFCPDDLCAICKVVVPPSFPTPRGCSGTSWFGLGTGLRASDWRLVIATFSVTVHPTALSYDCNARTRSSAMVGSSFRIESLPLTAMHVPGVSNV